MPAGPLAIRNVADLYLYPNTVTGFLVAVSGATVREWLERSAGIFRQVPRRRPGVADQPLIEGDAFVTFPSYNFDVIDGVTYEIDVTQPSRYDLDGHLVAPEAHRIADLRYDGKPIDPGAMFVVVGNNYRASGGGNFPGVDSKAVIVAAPDTNRDVIVRFIHERGTINPTADNNWRLKRAPGTQRHVRDQSQGERSSARPRVPPHRRPGRRREHFRPFSHDVVAVLLRPFSRQPNAFLRPRGLGSGLA